MTTSEAPRNLAAALAAFQATMPVVAKTKTAQVRSDKGSYTYTYAGLAEVTAAAGPGLAANGLAFSCIPIIEDGRITLHGVLLHDSGEQLTGQLPIAGGTPQQVGSALTYARRYLLGCMTGIVTDDDDDGQAASKPAAKKTAAPKGTTVRRAPRAPAGQPTDDTPLPDPWAHTEDQPPGEAAPPHAPQVAPEPDNPDALSPALRRSLMAQTSRLGIDPTGDRTQRLALWSAVLAKRIATGNQLTRAEALTLLGRMAEIETGAVEWDYSVETGAVRLRHIDKEPGT